MELNPNEIPDSNLIRTEIIGFHNTVLPAFKTKWERAKENIGLVYDEHFTTKQLETYKLGERVPLQMPLIFSSIQSVLGFEKTNRNVIVVEANGAEDELNAEIANQQLKYIFKENRFEFTRDELFEDGIIAHEGILRIFLDEDEYGFSKVKIERVPYNRLVWDLNYTKYDMSDCSRKQYFEWVYLDDLIVMFPDKEQYIRDTIAQDRDSNDNDISPLVDTADYYVNPVDVNGRKREDKYIIKVIHDYVKVNKLIYELHNIKTGDIDEYEDKKSAEEAKSQAFMQLQADMVMEQIGQGIMPQPLNPDEYFVIKPVPKKRVKYTCCTINHLLTEPDWLEDGEDEFINYAAIFKDGKTVTLVDILRDTQMEYDKLWTQMDYSVATDVKTTFGGDHTKLHPSNTPEQAKQTMVRGGMIWFQGNPGDAIVPLESKGADPSYFTLMEGLKYQSQDATGGKQFQGLPDPSNKTAAGIEMLQSAATMQAANYLKNLEKTDIQVGEKVIKLIQKHYTYEDTIKILGAELTEKVKRALSDNGFYQQSTLDPDTGWLKINAKTDANGNPVKPLGDSSFVVTIQSKDARMNDAQFKLRTLAEYGAQFGKSVPEKLIGRLMGLTPTEIQELEDEQRRVEQMQAQAQAETNRIQEMKNLGDLVTKGAQLQQNGQREKESGNKGK